MTDERRPKPRVAEPQRNQVQFRFEVPEDALPPTHPARLLWDMVGKLDLSKFLDGVKAVEGTVGRKTLSPRMKLVLWLYAISRAIGSSREIARLVKTDDAFRWIVGNLSVGHHCLSEFRVGHGKALEVLMTDVLASLMHKQVLSLELVAQDGMRVRADASPSSFRSYGSLLECRAQAALHLKAVLAEADDPQASHAEKARREAAARDFQRRVEEAVETVKELQESPKRRGRVVRASTTDADARNMKMGDGGFRPAYNIQMATAGSPLGGPRTIVGVQVTNQGTDYGGMETMLDTIERWTAGLPATLLADAGHASHADISAVTARGVELLMPVPELSKDPDQGNLAPEIVAWRNRMETSEAKRLFRARAGLCELMNAHVRTRYGLDHFLVRGLPKVTSVVLLTAITSNLLQHALTLLA
jgi:transposase